MVVSRVADEQPPSTKPDPARVAKLPGAVAQSADSRDRHEPAGAGIELLDPPFRAIEKVDCPIDPDCHIAWRPEPAKATTWLDERPPRAIQRHQGEREVAGAKLQADTFHRSPPSATVQKPRLRVVGRSRDRWQIR